MLKEIGRIRHRHEPCVVGRARRTDAPPPYPRCPHPVSASLKASSMKIRSVVARGLLLLSIGVMTGGCATTDTKSSAAKAPDSTSTRGGSTGQQAGGTRYLVKDFHAEDSNEPGEDPGALAQAGQ